MIEILSVSFEMDRENKVDRVVDASDVIGS